jgi:IS30 family transposase
MPSVSATPLLKADRLDEATMALRPNCGLGQFHQKRTPAPTPISWPTERRRGGRLATEPGLAEVIRSKVELEWSPEQIAVWLRIEFPDRRRWHVCHETIYRALDDGATGGLSRQLTRELRTGRPLRKRRRRANERTPRFIAPALLIDHRPAVVEDRLRVGDWEGDT